MGHVFCTHISWRRHCRVVCYARSSSEYNMFKPNIFWNSKGQSEMLYTHVGQDTLDCQTVKYKATAIYILMNKIKSLWIRSVNKCRIINFWILCVYIYMSLCLPPWLLLGLRTTISFITHQCPLWVDKVSMLTHIYPHKPWRNIEVTICNITRLTAHFMCGLMSDLLICICL